MKILIKLSSFLLFTLCVSANCVCQSSLNSWEDNPEYCGFYIDKSGDIHKSVKRSRIPVTIQKKDSGSCYFYFDPFLPSNVQLHLRGDTIVSELSKVNGYPNGFSNGILAIFGSIGDSWKLDNMYFLRMESRVRLNNIFFDERIQDTVYCYNVNGPGNRSHSDYITDYALTKRSGLIAYRMVSESDNYGQAYVFLNAYRKQIKRKVLIEYWEEKFGTPHTELFYNKR